MAATKSCELIYESPLAYGEIRVLDIERARSPQDVLTCTLYTVLLQHVKSQDEPTTGSIQDMSSAGTHDNERKTIFNRRTYITLSYTWGNTSESGVHLTHQVNCNGQLLSITKNLHDALVRIREVFDRDPAFDHDCRPLVWADAICINQASVKERNQQVAFMADIYRHSSRLFIWLGNLKVDQAVDNLELPEILDRLAMGVEEPDAGDQMHYSLEGKKRPPPATPIMVKLLDEILQAPWFTRRWIVQEVAVTPTWKRNVLIGSHLVADSKLLQAALSCDRGNLRSLRALMPETRQDSLLYLLCYYYDLICKDPHDTIYAFRSLCSPGSTLAVTYQRPPAETFLEFATMCVKRGEALILLACATAYQAREMPYWVPWWHNSPSMTNADHVNAMQSYCLNGPAEHFLKLVQASPKCSVFGSELFIDVAVIPAAALIIPSRYLEISRYNFGSAWWHQSDRSLVHTWRAQTGRDHTIQRGRNSLESWLHGGMHLPEVSTEEQQEAIRQIHDRVRNPHSRQDEMVMLFPGCPIFFTAIPLELEKTGTDEVPPLRLRLCAIVRKDYPPRIPTHDFLWKYALKTTARLL